jgi:hypothetical protein
MTSIANRSYRQCIFRMPQQTNKKSHKQTNLAAEVPDRSEHVFFLMLVVRTPWRRKFALALAALPARNSPCTTRPDLSLPSQTKIDSLFAVLLVREGLAVFMGGAFFCGRN